MITLCLFLFFLAVCFALKQKIQACLWALCLGLLIFFSVGSGMIPRYLMIALESPYWHLPALTWQKQNVLVLLGGGTVKLPGLTTLEPTTLSYPRIVKTVQLYRECQVAQQVCRVIISGGDVHNEGASEAQVYANTLIQLGVTPQAIILEDKSLNTKQNAQFTAAILQQHDFGRVILVTSGAHLKRAMKDFASQGIHTVPVAADAIVPRLTWFPNSYNFLFTDWAIHEYFGILLAG